MTADCTPISEFARRALDKRLRKTGRLIKKLADRSQASPKFVHKLRVSIRRSEAALRVFRPLLPAQRSRRLLQRLKQLRQLAGDVRDIDVFLAQCSRSEVVATAVCADRASLQRSREELAHQLRRRARKQRRFRRAIQKTVGRVRWRSAAAEPSVAAASPELLRSVARRCLKSAGRDLRNLNSLHRVRIDIKRVRYACELLQIGLNRSACSELLTLLSDLQRELGDVCDLAMDLRLLAQAGIETEEWNAALAAARRSLIARQTDFVIDWEQQRRRRLQQLIAACVN